MRRVTDKDIPNLAPHEGSWVLIRIESNEVIGEISKSDKGKLKALNADNVKILTITQHLNC